MVNLTFTLFQIRLEDDSLTLRGSQTESVGCVLRGQLVLVITKQTKFKEIRLTFQGKSKVRWVDSLDFKREEKILYQHDWTFLPAKKQYHVLKPDNYHWDFELVLPGTLPETIEGYQHGSIKYTLIAVAKGHFFSRNLHAQRKITLTRSLLPSSLEYLQAAITANTLTNIIEYEFSLDSKVFCLGDKIPIMINLRSIEKDLKVQNILCVLKEYVTCTVGTNRKTYSKIIRIANDSSFSQNVNSWNHIMEISIPKNSVYCHYDSRNDMICIKHKLKFYTTLINRNRPYKLKADLEVIITSISSNSDRMNLPAYDENYLDYLDKSYSEDKDSPTCQYSTLSALSSTYCSFAESLNEVPSYRSVSSLIPVPLAYSLLPPVYDDSTNGH